MRIVSCITILYAFTAFSEPPSPSFEGLYQKVFDADFDSVESSFTAIDNPTAYEIYAYSISRTLAYGLRGDRSYDDYHSKVDELMRNLPDTQEGIFITAEIYLQKMIVHALEKNELDALLAFRQAILAAEKCKEKYPGFLPVNKSLGVIHTILASVPDEYQWILSILGWETTPDMAMGELESLKTHPVWRHESAIYMSLIYTLLLEDPDTGVKVLESEYGNSPSVITKYLLNFSYYKNFSSSKMLTFTPSEGDKIPHMYYLLAESLIQKGNYNKAEKNYLRYLENYNGEYLLKDSYYKLFLTSYLSSENPDPGYLTSARAMGRTTVEADKNAEKQLENPHIHKGIMRARLATDGGYFTLAESILSEIDIADLSGQEQLEYHYRQARLLDETDKTEAAISRYREVIDLQGDRELYFAPNSCLKLGTIYRNKGEAITAELMYRKALEYRNYPYKKSIDRKAKAGLSVLRDTK